MNSSGTFAEGWNFVDIFEQIEFSSLSTDVREYLVSTNMTNSGGEEKLKTSLLHFLRETNIENALEFEGEKNSVSGVGH